MYGYEAAAQMANRRLHLMRPIEVVNLVKEHTAFIVDRNNIGELLKSNNVQDVISLTSFDKRKKYLVLGYDDKYYSMTKTEAYKSILAKFRYYIPDVIVNALV